jgi:hypothetical protein
METVRTKFFFQMNESVVVALKRGRVDPARAQWKTTERWMDGRTDERTDGWTQTDE